LRREVAGRRCPRFSPRRDRFRRDVAALGWRHAKPADAASWNGAAAGRGRSVNRAPGFPRWSTARPSPTALFLSPRPRNRRGPDKEGTKLDRLVTGPGRIFLDFLGPYGARRRATRPSVLKPTSHRAGRRIVPSRRMANLGCTRCDRHDFARRPTRDGLLTLWAGVVGDVTGCRTAELDSPAAGVGGSAFPRSQTNDSQQWPRCHPPPCRTLPGPGSGLPNR
jgi:hypothetical protein